MSYHHSTLLKMFKTQLDPWEQVDFDFLLRIDGCLPTGFVNHTSILWAWIQRTRYKAEVIKSKIWGLAELISLYRRVNLICLGRIQSRCDSQQQNMDNMMRNRSIVLSLPQKMYCDTGTKGEGKNPAWLAGLVFGGIERKCDPMAQLLLLLIRPTRIPNNPLRPFHVSTLIT